MTAGIDLYSREIRYKGQFTQASAGGNVVFGFQVMPFARMFVNYSYEQVKVKELNPLYNNPAVLAREPVPCRLAADRQGRPADDQQDRSELRLQHRRPPDLPDDRHALHDVVRLRRDRRQHQLRESTRAKESGISRSASGAARRSGSAPRRSTSHRTAARRTCPSSRSCSSAANTACAASTCGPSGRAIRPPASSSAATRACCSTLEYLISIAGPVRLVLFYDAGQVRDRGQNFGWKEPVTQTTLPGALFPVLRRPLFGADTVRYTVRSVDQRDRGA